MRHGKDDSTDEATGLDPVAITLAIWLGLVTLVTGMVRLSEAASIQAAHAQARQVTPQVVDTTFAVSMP